MTDNVSGAGPPISVNDLTKVTEDMVFDTSDATNSNVKIDLTVDNVDSSS